MSNYKYLSKSPCGEDLFAGKVHEKTAEQIASQLLDGTKSLIIGIDGGWGTGKSNLIRMIEKQVSEKKKDALFFTYDAWGHQNDLPRRSILEELTRTITQSNALSEKAKKPWRDKLKTLMSQRKEVSTRTIPKVSDGIIVISLIVILTPTFSAIGEHFPSSEYQQCWKIVITALPLLFGFVYSLYKYFCSKNKNRKSFWGDFISLYQERTKEETTYEEVFSEEPTSSQFRDWMKELDSHLQAPLILVFDNMDRLPAAKVQELWAAIHTYFAEEAYENIQVIVPFDRIHIISAFKGEDCNTDGNYGNDFIDKTFDIVFRVAPPTLSNWKGYLYAKWKEAFGEQLTPQHSVTQIYDLLTESKTPREIVAFINECVTIRQTCATEIPIEYVALFVVGKQKIENAPHGQLIGLEFLEPLAYKYRTPETSKYLSALYYQLSPDDALDLVYTDQLRRELESGESALLQQLVSQSIFSEILENAITKVSQVEQATRAFAIVEQTTPIAKIFWNQLVLKATKDDKSPKDYQIDLLKHAAENVAAQYLEDIVKAIYAQCTLTNDSPTISIAAHSFYQAINKLETELAAYNHLTPLSLLKKTKTPPDAFLDFVNAAKGTYENYQMYCPMEEVDAHITSPFNVSGAWGMIRFLPPAEKQQLRRYKAELESALQDVSEVNTAEILMTRWIELEATSNKLLSDYSIDSLFLEVEEGSLLYHCLICMRIALGDAYRYSSMDSILQNEDQALASILGQYIQRFATYEALLMMYSTMGEYHLFKQLLQHIVSEQLGKQLSIKTVLPHILDISENLKIPLDQLLQDWERWPPMENSIIKDFAGSIPYRFYEETASLSHRKLVAQTREVEEELLRAISVDDWKTKLEKGGKEYQLLLLLKCECPNAYEAFKQTIKLEFEEQTLSISNNVYNSLVTHFNNLGKNWTSVFLGIRTMYGNNGKDITADLFVRYGKSLLLKADLAQNQNAIRSILPTALLNNSQTADILVQHQSEVVHILDHAEKTYKDEFCREVLSVHNANDKLKEHMRTLISALRIEKSKPEVSQIPCRKPED